MGGELWLPVPDHPLYEVSSQGRVRSWNKWGGTRRLPQPRMMHPNLSRGYPYVLIHRQMRKVHRLVALAFHGPPPFEGALVRHLNDIPTDNRVENLAWGTAAQNSADRIRNGPGYTTRGESHGRAKLTEADVRAIRRMAEEGETHRVLGEMYGIDPSTVSMIRTRRIWKWLE